MMPERKVGAKCAYPSQVSTVRLTYSTTMAKFHHLNERQSEAQVHRMFRKTLESRLDVARRKRVCQFRNKDMLVASA